MFLSALCLVLNRIWDEHKQEEVSDDLLVCFVSTNASSMYEKEKNGDSDRSGCVSKPQYIVNNSIV